ncbi:MAG TPA: ATP-binding protein, partial [Syntrophobacteraceae bacterium]|nr:ATP-binding protein [Syntrophobacteraceae bacterium]
ITRLEDGRFIEVNDAFTSIMGFTWEEVASSSPVSLMLWVNEADRKQVVSTLLDGGTVAGREFSFRKKNGEIIDGLLSARIIHLNQGPCILSSIDDITLRKRSEAERLRLEQRIRQAEKAASLGRMAGAIAHHFNNLLGAVMGNLELTKAVLPPDSKADEFIAQAMQASRRAAGISRSMLATLGQAVGTKAPIRLTEICREALPALAASLPEGVCLKIDLPDEGPTILADAVQIRQVLSNLVVNAGEAVGDREGDVTVAVGVMPAADLRGSRFHPPDWEPTEEDYVCLSVSDTGVGMDAETMEKAFDPFFTTKFTGRGLGLAVLLGVVKGHEGAVMVESTPGSGSVFRVLLPVCIE